MGGWLRLVSWHLHGISARDVPGVTDVLQLAGWQQLTEVRLFCSRFRMRFFDSKDGIGDSRNRDEPENIRDSSFPGEIHHRDTESTKFSLGLPEDTLSDGSGVPSRCNTSILKQFPNAKKRGQPLQQTFFSLADLGALCVSVVKSSSSANLVARSSTAVRYAVCEA